MGPLTALLHPEAPDAGSRYQEQDHDINHARYLHNSCLLLPQVCGLTGARQ